MIGKLMTASVLLAASALATAADAPAGPPGGGAGGPGGGAPRMTPEERFAAVDANKDGKLNLEEFSAMRGRGGRPGGGGGPGGPGGQAGGPPQGAAGGPPQGAAGGPPGGGGGQMGMAPEERFKAMDTNKDGFVNLAEYKTAMEQTMQQRPGG